MRSAPPRFGLPWLFLFLFLFAAQVIPNLFENSPTADEPGEITGGYFYWQGGALSDIGHPPLARTLQALPLRLMALRQDLDPGARNFITRAYDFFFILNPDKFEGMLHAARFISLLFGLGIGVLLFQLTRGAPPVQRIAVMVLWAFEPTLLAFAGLSVADEPVTFFVLAAVAAFQKHLETPGLKQNILTGVLTAMAVTCKFSALALIPVFALLEFLNRPRTRKTWNAKAKDWVWGFLAFLIGTGLLYLPNSFFSKPPLLPWAYLKEGLTAILAQTGAYHPVYFLGEAGRHSHWLYYPLAFVLKSAAPLLFLFLLALGLARQKKILFPTWVWLPAAVFFISIVPVQNLGVRYLLPAYPFVILMAAQAAGRLWTFKLRSAPKLGKILVIALLMWHSETALINHSDLLSYFNDFVPPQKKIYCLADSNLDWGQDEKRLAQTAAQRGWIQVKAAQLGGVDLSLYGLKAIPWTKRDLSQPQPGQVYVVNASFLQLGPVFYPDLEPLAKSWMGALPPSGQVGDTWFYWEIPGILTPDPSAALPSIRTAGTLYQDEIKEGR